MCSISAHAQTFNEYPDAKNTFERIFVAALLIVGNNDGYKLLVWLSMHH